MTEYHHHYYSTYLLTLKMFFLLKPQYLCSWSVNASRYIGPWSYGNSFPLSLSHTHAPMLTKYIVEQCFAWLLKLMPEALNLSDSAETLFNSEADTHTHTGLTHHTVTLTHTVTYEDTQREMESDWHHLYVLVCVYVSKRESNKDKPHTLNTQNKHAFF